MVINDILGFAESIPAVKVVVMNGSRVNPNAPVDKFQDYDLIFFVEDPAEHDFKLDLSWISRFGDPVITQQNNFENGSYIVMTQYKSGLRIDLNFYDLKFLEETIAADSLTRVLFDRDNQINDPHVPDESTYYIVKPTQKEFTELMNEFWWIQSYITKGLLRNEITYAKYMFDNILIECVKKVLNWEIGFKHNWQVNTGKCGKWLKNYLPGVEYTAFLELYPSIDPDDILKKLLLTQQFVHEKAQAFSSRMEFKYNLGEADRVIKFIKTQFQESNLHSESDKRNTITRFTS